MSRTDIFMAAEVMQQPARCEIDDRYTWSPNSPDLPQASFSEYALAKQDHGLVT
jgi:hypothetical protein